jgi:hypothetical protein
MNKENLVYLYNKVLFHHKKCFVSNPWNCAVMTWFSLDSILPNTWEIQNPRPKLYVYSYCFGLLVLLLVIYTQRLILQHEHRAIFMVYKGVSILLHITLHSLISNWIQNAFHNHGPYLWRTTHSKDKVEAKPTDMYTPYIQFFLIKYKFISVFELRIQ